jgi:hypothetical protein
MDRPSSSHGSDSALVKVLSRVDSAPRAPGDVRAGCDYTRVRVLGYRRRIADEAVSFGLRWLAGNGADTAFVRYCRVRTIQRLRAYQSGVASDLPPQSKILPAPPHPHPLLITPAGSGQVLPDRFSVPFPNQQSVRVREPSKQHPAREFRAAASQNSRADLCELVWRSWRGDSWRGDFTRSGTKSSG